MSDTMTISRQEYQDLIDTRDGAAALAAVANGTMETFSQADADAYLKAPTPLAFWRKHRQMTQKALAEAAGISQPYLAQIEKGIRNADVRYYVAFAKALSARLDDIVPQ